MLFHFNRGIVGWDYLKKTGSGVVLFTFEPILCCVFPKLSCFGFVSLIFFLFLFLTLRYIYFRIQGFFLQAYVLPLFFSLSVSISQGRGTFPYCSGPARSESKQGGWGGDRNRGKPKASLSSLLETKKRERELENKVVEETRRQGFIYTPTKWQAHTQWHRDLYIYLPGRRPSSCTSRSL